MATNTTKTIKAPKINNAELDAQIKKAGEAFLSEKKVNFAVPKVLKPQIGDHLPIGINGAWVSVPVDGQDYEIPESFAEHGKAYLRNME